MNLSQIGAELVKLAGELSFRATAVKAARMGELLLRGKKLCKHNYLTWVKSLGIAARSAQVYTQIARYPGKLNDDMTINQFLQLVRHAKRQGVLDARQEQIAAALARPIVQSTIHHADCREFKWPTFSVLVTDPPWRDVSCYHWLAKLMREKWTGDLALIQLMNSRLPEILPIFSEFPYCKIFAVVYGTSSKGFAWCPVLVYGRRSLQCSDAITINNQKIWKQRHPWQQPERPFLYWLQQLCKPGDVVADPYSGSGTTAYCCRQLGIQFCGTEINRQTWQVACDRLASV